jgi:aspartate/methionine/tyrosine aminotransferase
MTFYELFQCLCEEGDEVVTFGPCWGSDADIDALSGARLVVVQRGPPTISSRNPPSSPPP